MSARPQERQTAQPVAAWAHTEDRGRGAGLLPRGRWGGPPLSCLEDLTLHLFPRSPNFTNNPSTCSLHLLRSQSAQAHPFPCSAFFQLLGQPEHPGSRGAPLSLSSGLVQHRPRHRPLHARCVSPRSFPWVHRGPHGCASSPVQIDARPPPSSRAPAARVPLTAGALTSVHQAQGVREGGVQRVLLRHQLRQVLLLHARRPPGPLLRPAARARQPPRSPSRPPPAARTPPGASAAKPGGRPGGGGGSGRAAAAQPGPVEPQITALRAASCTAAG